MQNFQQQMASFAAWGLHAEQSLLIVRATASLKPIEQYQIPGRVNRPAQQRLAAANRLLDEANQLKRWAEQQLGQIRQPR